MQGFYFSKAIRKEEVEPFVTAFNQKSVHSEAPSIISSRLRT
jgi:hypothetical protein